MWTLYMPYLSRRVKGISQYFMPINCTDDQYHKKMMSVLWAYKNDQHNVGLNVTLFLNFNCWATLHCVAYSNTEYTTEGKIDNGLGVLDT